jgi:hypothetical protein
MLLAGYAFNDLKTVDRLDQPNHAEAQVSRVTSTLKIDESSTVTDNS